jgi:hypothetical protein
MAHRPEPEPSEVEHDQHQNQWNGCPYNLKRIVAFDIGGLGISLPVVTDDKINHHRRDAYQEKNRSPQDDDEGEIYALNKI